jgi:phosphatidate phosphatase LPIN
MSIMSMNRIWALTKSGTIDLHAQLLADAQRPASGDWSAFHSQSDEISRPSPDAILLQPPFHPASFERATSQPPEEAKGESSDLSPHSPPHVSENNAYIRAVNLSKKLWSSNIPTQVSPTGDLMLDMTGYKSSEESALKTEVMARKILAEELEGNYDIGALIGADERGNLWIYSSEEAKEAAGRKVGLRVLNPAAMRSADALSDPGYHSDDGQSDNGSDHQPTRHTRRDSDSAVGLSAPGSPEEGAPGQSDEPVKNYAKTLRLTSDQLKSLDLKHGANFMTFTVNKATCPGYIYYWRHDVPIVISDIDGTITKLASTL